jgi:hypothetical protein
MTQPEPAQKLTALTDPENVQFELVPDDEEPGTGLTPEQATAVMNADPSTYGPQEKE